MSILIEKALALIDDLEIRRAREINESVLDSMTGPIIDGQEQKQIKDCFTSKDYLEDDKKGHLSSFVVMSPTNIPLIFFSLRCGELFQVAELEKMQIGYEGRKAYCRLERKEYSSEEEKSQLKEALKRAMERGMRPDEMKYLYDKKNSWKKDEELEHTKAVTKVRNSYPAVELKLFGTNEAGKEYWKSLGLPKEIKMGETLFWLKVVDTLEQMHKYVGCQYVYLFAADKEADGQLVQYYRVRLGFKSDASLSANKPEFDWQCQFLFQGIEDLFNRRMIFKNLLKDYTDEGTRREVNK